MIVRSIKKVISNFVYNFMYYFYKQKGDELKENGGSVML